MIQTTLFNYFKCNGSFHQIEYKVHSLKQTNLNDYFNTVLKKKNKRSIKPKKRSILNYFKPKEEENKEFNIILADLLGSSGSSLETYTVKKNMYDPDLKYIAISYQWGEFEEQPVKTDDYANYITTFNSFCIRKLYHYLKDEPDLKEIPYVWIDSISIDQKNHENKMETILKKSEIYKNATYILVIPDLHETFSLIDVVNNEMINLIRKYSKTIYEELHYQQQQQQQQLLLLQPDSFINKIKNTIKQTIDIKSEEKKKVYNFLANLIINWSNDIWAISDYLIAIEKYKQQGIPLKYTFMSLFTVKESFFSFYFDSNNDQLQQITIKDRNDYRSAMKEVVDSKTFNQFLKNRFTQRSYLELILNSKATKNEDRFNAILPLWKKYKHKIKSKNTISDWHITNMTSVRLKLYDIMDDLWDKATLLYACSNYTPIYHILPSFACHHFNEYLQLVERDNIHVAYDRYEKLLIKDKPNNQEKIKQMINEYRVKSKPLWIDNLTSIELNHHHHHQYLSVKSNSYFMKEVNKFTSSLYSSTYSFFEEEDQLHLVYIPFFNLIMPDYINTPSLKCTGICLIGNIDKNKWVIGLNGHDAGQTSFSDDYTFNIY